MGICETRPKASNIATSVPIFTPTLAGLGVISGRLMRIFGGKLSHLPGSTRGGDTERETGIISSGWQDSCQLLPTTFLIDFSR